MKSLTVVEDLHIRKDRGSCLLLGEELRPVRTLRFQRFPEAFHRRVVPAIGPSAHADLDAVRRKQLPIAHTGVLAAPISMMEQGVIGHA